MRCSVEYMKNNTYFYECDGCNELCPQYRIEAEVARLRKENERLLAEKEEEG